MLKQRMWLAVVLAASGLGAQAVTPDAQISAAQAHAKAARLASQRVLPQKGQKGASTLALTYDRTPALLTEFRAGKQLTVEPGHNQSLMRVSATDDLVGLRSLQIHLRGPSDQATSVEAPILPAPTQWTGAVAWMPTDAVEAGDWHVIGLTIEDYSDNWNFYDEAQLAQFGNTRITVTNPSGGADKQKPQLLAGRVMISPLSLSRTIPGSDGQAQYVRVGLDAQDVGVAGLREASVRLCIVGDRDCHYDMYLRGDASGERGSEAATLEAAGQLSWQQLVGTYEIREVSLIDQAGNQTFLTSRTYGGDTDFATLFSSTTLKVKP